jgi:hypothetical protein
MTQNQRQSLILPSVASADFAATVIGRLSSLLPRIFLFLPV